MERTSIRRHGKTAEQNEMEILGVKEYSGEEDRTCGRNEKSKQPK